MLQLGELLFEGEHWPGLHVQDIGLRVRDLLALALRRRLLQCDQVLVRDAALVLDLDLLPERDRTARPATAASQS